MKELHALVSSDEHSPDVPGGEVSFGLDELFFSRTDTAGIIKSGNSVFQRISGYS